jgi:hypothetical protein
MKNEVKNKLSLLIATAFGLVAALAWNDAIRSLFNEGGILFFVAAYGVWVYAILVTIIAVLVTVWFDKISK